MLNNSTERPIVMVVYGTRPEAIKVAPVIRALRAAQDLEVFTVVTAQHREMLDQVNEVFGIHPDADLDLMSPGQTLNHLASTVIRQLDAVYERVKPSAVLVQGDTTTVMAAAIAAFNREVPVVHLEAGLRSGDIRSPFPEEANRRLVSQVASTHLAPTEESKRNLLAEGVKRATIVVTGNTVIDALKWAVDQREEFCDPTLEQIPADARVVLITAHRRENLGANMTNIGRAVRALAEKYPAVIFVWPAHKNPRVRETIGPLIDTCVNVIQIEPVAYDEFALLLARASIVLTDSGGLQEEAPSLGKPVLVMRSNTERPEAVTAGTVKLIGADTDRIVEGVSILLDSTEAYAQMAKAVNPYGDGRASERVVAALRHELSSGGRVLDFTPPSAQNPFSIL